MFYSIKKFGQIFPAFGQLNLSATSLNEQVGKKVNVKPWQLKRHCESYYRHFVTVFKHDLLRANNTIWLDEPSLSIVQ